MRVDGSAAARKLTAKDTPQIIALLTRPTRRPVNSGEMKGASENARVFSMTSKERG